MDSLNKRHHYLTRFYLEGFTGDNGKIWSFKKDDPLNPFPNISTETALIRNFYSINENGFNPNIIEDYLADRIEAPAANALKLLREKQFPTGTDREKLSLFFGILMVRTPIYTQHLSITQNHGSLLYAKTCASNKEYFHELFKKSNTDADYHEIENIRNDLLNDKFRITTNREYLFETMLKLGNINGQLLNSLKWILIETSDMYPFITSDNPFYITNPDITHAGFYKPGINMEKANTFIPISNNLILLITNNTDSKSNQVFSDKSFKEFNKLYYQENTLKDLVKKLNKAIFCKAFKFVFTSSGSEKLKRCFINLKQKAKLVEELNLNK